MNRRPVKSRSGYDSFSPRHTAHFNVDQPDGHFFEPRRKRRPGLLIFLLLFAAASLLLSINFVRNQFVHVAHVSVPIRGMNESFEDYTILHLSDLKGSYFGTDQRFLQMALKKEHFDVVALTGDMVSSRGNAQPLYALIDMLREVNPDAPIYFIPGDTDPTPTSMAYAQGGSPFAPWVLGAQQRGAHLLSAPIFFERDGQKLWLTTSALLNLDLDTMQGQFERQYLNALQSGDENEIELSKYNLNWLENTRTARTAMKENDIYISLTHVPPTDEELLYAPPGSLSSRLHLVLCGHYMGGLLRLPGIGPIFMPSQNLPLYGLFPGKDTYCGLVKKGSTYLYDSPGLGSNDGLYPSFFFRLFNPPTATLLSLTPSTL